jgi:hypothetical protein
MILYADIADLLFWRILILRQSEGNPVYRCPFCENNDDLRLMIVTGSHGDPCSSAIVPHMATRGRVQSGHGDARAKA